MMQNRLCKTILVALSSVLLVGCSSKETTLNTVTKIPAGYSKKVTKFDSIYEAERKQLLADTIKRPTMPVKTADKILRVLIMPYVDENNVLQTENFQFTKVDEGRWIVGEYLNNSSKESKKILTPLKDN